jgi:hypothetical protein
VLINKGLKLTVTYNRKREESLRLFWEQITAQRWRRPGVAWSSRGLVGGLKWKEATSLSGLPMTNNGGAIPAGCYCIKWGLYVIRKAILYL